MLIANCSNCKHVNDESVCKECKRNYAPSEPEYKVKKDKWVALNPENLKIIHIVTETKRSEKLKLIIRHYGVMHQVKYLFGEIFELTEAIIRGDRDHIVEEFADVQVLLSQLIVHFGINTSDVNEIMDFKINRQLDRIKKEGEQE